MIDIKGYPHSMQKQKTQRIGLWKLGLLAVLSAIWIMRRTGRKPTRIVYPCQHVAVSNIKIFRYALLAPVPLTIFSLRKSWRYVQPMLILSTLLVSSFVLVNNNNSSFNFSQYI
ncbi:MAG TPA: hypothetical protein ENI29_09335 [bacterium]|nr:hypothetical protein [bacterium]